MSYLLVNNEDPVELEGYIDGADNLQIKHANGNLVDYDQEIWCAHATETSIKVVIYDFVDDSITWTVSAEHDLTAWTRETDHVWFTFTEEPSSPIEVEITATNGSNSKPRSIFIKPQPQLPNLLLQPELVLGSVQS